MNSYVVSKAEFNELEVLYFDQPEHSSALARVLSYKESFHRESTFLTPLSHTCSQANRQVSTLESLNMVAMFL